VALVAAPVEVITPAPADVYLENSSRDTSVARAAVRHRATGT
jgi:hypothetical protein